MAEWPIQKAKNKFSALVNAALAGEPQQVTRRGQPAVVVIAAEEYERLCQAEKAGEPDFIEHLWPYPRRPMTTLSSCRREPGTSVPGKSISDVPVGHRRRLSIAEARTERRCFGLGAQSNPRQTKSLHQRHHSGRNLDVRHRPANRGRGLTVVTRNVRHFEPTGVSTLNPIE